MTKHLFLTICIISGYIWTDVASAQSSDQEADLMPEFCVATFLTTGNAAEATIWLNRYDLNRAYITYMQLNLEAFIKEGEIRAEDVMAAVDECKAANDEAESDE